MNQNMTLLEILAEYVLERPVSTASEYQLRRTINIFGTFVQRTPIISDLTDQTVSKWLQSLESTYSQRTIVNQRKNLLAVWRYAAEVRLVTPPHRVRKIKVPEPCPIAWLMEELLKIVKACEELTGIFPSGAGRRDYCLGLVHAAYDTGLRRSDLWTLPTDRVRDDGTVALLQHKTGHAHPPVLRSDALSLFRRLPGKCPLACPYSCQRAWYRFWNRHVIKVAGVRPGCMQQIRRTGATWLFRSDPAAVQRYLGHRCATMQKHYVDMSIAYPVQQLPPSLTG